MSTNSSLFNSTDAATGVFSGGRIGSFGYGMSASIGILLLITMITLASYFCTRTNPDTRAPRSRSANQTNTVNSEDLELGIDEATLKTYPEVLYAEAKQLLAKENKEEQNKAGLKVILSSATSACCSVCLADYKDTDVLRVLPDCGHMFHVACVDPWLRSRPTCPVCRTSPMPSPMATPLVEVAPLIRQR